MLQERPAGNTHEDGNTDEDVGHGDATGLEVDEREQDGGTTKASLSVYCSSSAASCYSRHETERSRVTELAVEDGESRLRVVHGVAAGGDEARDLATRASVLGRGPVLVDLLSGGGHCGC